MAAGIAAWLLLAGFLAVLADGYLPSTIQQLLWAVLFLGPLLLFGELLFHAVVGTGAYFIGRMLLPLVTFGTVRAEAEGESDSFPWYGVARRGAGPRVASGELTMVFGLAALALVAVAAFVAYRHLKP
jgi:hypothetical protein